MTTSPTQAAAPAAPPYALPPLGDNPSTARQGTSPGSFARPGAVGSPLTFSSPDAPGMPAASDKTAWDLGRLAPDRVAQRDVLDGGGVADAVLEPERRTRRDAHRQDEGERSSSVRKHGQG